MDPTKPDTPENEPVADAAPKAESSTPDAKQETPKAAPSTIERQARATAVLRQLGIFAILATVIGLIVFNTGSSVSDAETAKKRTVREGEFDISDSKVTEFDNLRKRVSTQVNTQSDDLKKVLEDNARRDREFAELKRQISESTALGGARLSENLDQDLAKLSDPLRDLFPQAVEEMERHAIETGNIAYQDALPSFNPWVRKRVQTATDAEIERLADLARVRRKSPTDDQYVTIPSLAARRAALGIPKDNLPAIAKMIWTRRASLPPMTAGQMVGMAHLTALTTQDAPTAAVEADPRTPQQPAAQPQPDKATTWGKASLGRITLAEPIQIGPISSTSEQLRMAVRGITPLIAEYATPAATPVDGKIKGLTFALGLSDARLLATLAEAPNDATAVDRAIHAIEGDVQLGSQIATSVEVRDTRSPQIGVEQMVALRAVTVGATAAQTVLNATEPVLDSQVLAGLAKPPGPDLVGIALSNDNKEGAILVRLLDSALRRPDGSSGFPASVAQIKERVQAITPAIEVQARALMAEGVRQPAMQAFRRLALLAAALPYATVNTTADLAKQRNAATKNIAQIAVWVAASDLVEIEIRQSLIPRYSQNYLTLSLDWEALANSEVIASQRVVRDAVAGALLQGTTPEVVTSAVGTIRRTAGPLAEGAVNRAIVRQIVLSSIAEASIGKDRLVVESVHEYLDSQIERLVVPEYTDERIRITAGSISRDCIAILTGKRNLPRKRVGEEGATSASSAMPPVTGGQPPRAGIPSSVVGIDRSQPTGPRQEFRVVSFAPQATAPAGHTRPMAGPANLSGQVVTLQSGSYGEAYLYSGGEVALGSTARRTCLINLNHTWRGTGSIVRMRDMKILAEVSPLPGSTKRMLLDLKRLSFRFPSGLLVERDCTGFVVDGYEGRDGIIAEMRLNLEELAPLATGTGLLGGLKTTLEAFTRPTTGSSVVINNNTGASEPATIPKSAYAAGALAGAVEPFEEYMRRSMGFVAPTLVAQNGQALTVVLTAPVVFDGVAAKEWAAIMGDAALDSNLFR